MTARDRVDALLSLATLAKLLQLRAAALADAPSGDTVTDALIQTAAADAANTATKLLDRMHDAAETAVSAASRGPAEPVH